MKMDYILRSKLQFLCSQLKVYEAIEEEDIIGSPIESNGDYDLDSNSVLRILELITLISIGFCVLACASYTCIQLKSSLEQENSDNELPSVRYQTGLQRELAGLSTQQKKDLVIKKIFNNFQ